MRKDNSEHDDWNADHSWQLERVPDIHACPCVSGPDGDGQDPEENQHGGEVAQEPRGSCWARIFRAGGWEAQRLSVQAVPSQYHISPGLSGCEYQPAPEPC